MSNHYNPKLFSEQEMGNPQQELFSDEAFRDTDAAAAATADGPVTVLGMTFPNDEARREYFRDELRRRLPELRHIEGFPIGEDEDIVRLSDPPYYTTCPNPWLNDFVAEWEQEKVQLEKEGKRKSDFEVKEPYASDVSEGRGEAIYNAHSYHTKVPPQAIRNYLGHFTQPGDIVLDGFSGSGMTGVAGKTMAMNQPNMDNDSIARKVILSDLAPAATNLSYNNTFNVNVSLFAQLANKILNSAYDKFGWMFKTKDPLSSIEYDVEYFVWSENSYCESCGQSFNFYDIAIDDETQSIKKESVCPNCGAVINRRTIKPYDEAYFDNDLSKPSVRPSRSLNLICYKVGGRKRFKKPDTKDLTLLEQVSQLGKTEVPTTEIPDMQMMRVGRMKSSHIHHIHEFYFERIRYVLGYMWSEAKSISDARIQNMLCYWLDSQFVNLSYRNRYRPNVSFPYNPMTGVFYIPMMSSESNPFVAYKNKLKKIIDAFNGMQTTVEQTVVSTSSASSLPLSDNSIDYIFTDPPFGENIYYSDLNYYIEAWNRVVTSTESEAIVDKVKNKSVMTYSKLIEQCFSEYYRVLKPGKWISIVFSNTSAAIWNGIQRAINTSGFVVASVASLNKQQGTFQAVNTTTAVTQDLVITCYKPQDDVVLNVSNNDSSESTWFFIEQHLAHLPKCVVRDNKIVAVSERSPRILFDRMISYFVEHNQPVPMDTQDFQKELRERFIERDGMYFTSQQASEYDEIKREVKDFEPMGLIVSSESDGIAWLKNQLREAPKTYQELQPEWMQAINGVRKGDILPELSQLLDENFIEEADGKWRLPNMQDDVDKEELRNKALLREFKVYVETAQKPKGKIKEARVEALRAGFKQCYVDKDFATIVLVGDRIPQNLRDEDEVLLQFYDIALNKM